MHTFKTYEGNLIACDVFGNILKIGSDVHYAHVDTSTGYKRPKISSGVILDIHLTKGVYVSYNVWDVVPKDESKWWYQCDRNNPEEWKRVEREIKVWVKIHNTNPLSPDKVFFENIYQIN